VSQRQRAKTPGVSLQVAWQSLPWKQVHRQVCRLHNRIDRATQRGEGRTVHTRQQRLARAWEARLLAVRRLTQDHRGRHTAGIDGGKSLTPPQRWGRAHERRLDGTARALRRLWIPTRGSTTANRPLGLPTQADRARHTLGRQALAPAWDAKLSAPTSGLRPGRSGPEAIGAILTAMRYRPQYALTIAMAQGFERIAHQALWAQVPAPPRMRRPRKAGLQAGLLAGAPRSPPTAGTPQGGRGAPRWALMALHGRPEAITQLHPHARVLTDAEEGVGLHEDHQRLEPAPELRKTGLAQRGWRWNEANRSMRHPWEGAQPGVTFRGCASRP
jgi:RNA-directed DNA polymerase